MPNFAGSLDAAKRNIVAIGVWYFAPYRHARKLFFSSAHFAEKVTDWELSRKFQQRQPALTWVFGLFIWLPFTALFYTLCVLPALLAITLSVMWPWVLTLISFLLLNLIF
jgi:hypothetical protein